MLSAAETQFLLPFIGRSDLFAEQHDNGAWTPVRRHVTDEDIEDHLAGRRTIGFYVVDPAGTVRSAVLDIDCPKELWERGEYGDAAKREQLQAARKLRDSVHALYGAAPLVEVSGRKGLHVWVPYMRRVDARIARLGCERVLADAGFRLGQRGHWIADEFPAARVELFPKQDKLEQGEVGNLVKLPLGVHRVSRQPSFLLDADLKRAEDPLPLLEAVWQ
jgi:hypothetical protein